MKSTDVGHNKGQVTKGGGRGGGGGEGMSLSRSGDGGECEVSEGGEGEGRGAEAARRRGEEEGGRTGLRKRWLGQVIGTLMRPI